MTKTEILQELRSMASETIRHVLAKHGAPANYLGVKIEDLKKIKKKVRKNYQLSLELYDTGISDARYLAGLVADEKKMTKADLRHWAHDADWSMLYQYTVPWVAAESAHGWELALEWIDSADEKLKACGWATLSSVVSIRNDDGLDLAMLRSLLQRVEQTIHSSSNGVRYVMNGFVIAVGGYVSPLTADAMKVARAIGKVTVDMGKTSCKVPSAPDYIQKMIDKGVVGKKRKMARC